MGIFTTAFSYIASLVGAGFASGQEVVSFFVKYGRWSIIGIFISVMIFGFFVYAVTDDCVKYKTDSYDTYLAGILPGFPQKLVRILTLVFSAVCFSAMASGCGAMCADLFNIKSIWGNAMLCAISALFFLKGNFKALKYNAAVGAVIIVGVISCCLYILGYREHQAAFNPAPIITSSVSYAGYNLITAGVILVKLSPVIKNHSGSVICAIISSIIIFTMLTLMWAVLSIYYGKIPLGDMPMLTLVMRESRIVSSIYAVMLFLSILTTAIASGVGVIEMTSNKFVLPLLFVFAVLSDFAGFTAIINIAYRTCGYLGVILPFYIIAKKYVKQRK